MSDQNETSNPFESPKVGEQAARGPKRAISIGAVILMCVISMFVGFCTFFCTCLGSIQFAPGSYWALWMVFATSILATILSFVLLMKRARRRTR